MNESELKLFRYTGNKEYKIKLIEKHIKKLSEIEKTIIMSEDILTHIYLDTKDIPTIGVGHTSNIEDDHCTLTQALNWLSADIEIAKNDCYKIIPFYSELSKKRKDVFLEILFNLGLPRFSKFKKTIEYLCLKQYNYAAIELLNSTWCKQVGDRSFNLAKQLTSDSNGGN